MCFTSADVISISRLLGADARDGDALRYGDRPNGRPGRHAAPRSAAERRPVVVWNATRTCNLRCVHCYSDSEARRYRGELSTDEGRALLDDLRAFGVPALLLSGGEPLVRPDAFDLLAHAKAIGLKVTLSTNGTLIDERAAGRLLAADVAYVGISLDGIGPTNDRFRGVDGAFDRAIRGIRACLAVGLKVGLRMTLTRHNVADLDRIFDLVEAERIPRVCFYHLVPSGRGRFLDADILRPDETRAAVEKIIRWADDLRRRASPIEVLTVANPADGPFLLLHLRNAADPRAGEVERRLAWNGGGLWGSGTGIACVGPTGDVHPDQFWREAVVGNVRDRPFSLIWSDPSCDLLAGLRDRLPRLRGRCAGCRFVFLCGGGFRARAAAAGDAWGPDPGCYLSDAEVGAA